MIWYKPRIPKQNRATYVSSSGGTMLARPMPRNLKGNFKIIALGLVLIFFSNLVSHTLFNPNVSAIAPAVAPAPISAPSQDLYLMDKASMFVPEAKPFEKKVREIAQMLRVPPEWLMAVMYSESKFDASVLNHKGSGATGLIQFMPAAASEMNVSLHRLARMNHLQQLEYVYMYLEKTRERYGNFNSLADLYLAILYPRARNQDYCYTLYAKPSKSYVQNSGLDENKDGRVTVSDIDRRMKRLYPIAYMAQIDS